MRPATFSSPALARARQCMAAKWVGAKWPLRWTLMTASQSASSMLKLMRSRRMPALFTRMSSPPSSSVACSMRRCPPFHDVMSSKLATAVPPALLISLTTSSAGRSSLASPETEPPTSLTTTDAPSDASRRASVRPIPRPAPVMTATLPSSRPIPHSCSLTRPSVYGLLAHEGQKRGDPSSFQARSQEGQRWRQGTSPKLRTMDEPQQVPEPHDPFGEGAAPDYARPEARSRRPWVIAAVVGVIVLVVGGFFGVKALAGGGSPSTSTAAQTPANGGPGNGGRRGTVGTLQSIDGSTLTVATFNRGGNDANGGATGGTATVITNGST